MRRIFLILWVVLCLTIWGCSLSQTRTSVNREDDSGQTYIILYFKGNDGSFLEPESRRVDTVQGRIEEAIVEGLIKGPQTSGHSEVVPSDTKLISVNVKGNTAKVDLKGDTIEKTQLAEWAVNSITNSLTELPYISDVKIYIEGRQFEKSFKRKRSAVKREDLNPSQVMDKQMKLEKKGEWMSAYMLMSDMEASKGRKSYDEYIKELQEVKKEGLLNADFEVGEYTIDPLNENIALVRVNFITTYSDGSPYKSPDLFFPCVKIDGYWKVDWLTEQDM